MSMITEQVKQLREEAEFIRETIEKDYPVTIAQAELMEQAADTIERLNTEWIRVDERMPEEREWMGTKRFGTTISDEVYVTLETPDGERFTKHLSFQNGGLSQTDQERMRVWFKGAVPIAWRPLPEPYNGGEG